MTDPFLERLKHGPIIGDGAMGHVYKAWSLRLHRMVAIKTIHQDRINENQGAESTLAFHLALAEMRLAQDLVVPQMRKG